MARDEGQEAAEAIVGAVTVGELGKVWIGFKNDLPSMFEDYFPDTGGTTADSFVCKFAGPPWFWPPDVTLRQSFRYLSLLNEAFS